MNPEWGGNTVIMLYLLVLFYIYVIITAQRGEEWFHNRAKYFYFMSTNPSINLKQTVKNQYAYCNPWSNY